MKQTKSYKHKQTGFIATEINTGLTRYYSVQVNKMATENISFQLIENTSDWQLIPEVNPMEILEWKSTDKKQHSEGYEYLIVRNTFKATDPNNIPAITILNPTHEMEAIIKAVENKAIIYDYKTSTGKKVIAIQESEETNE